MFALNQNLLIAYLLLILAVSLVGSWAIGNARQQFAPIQSVEVQL